MVKSAAVNSLWVSRTNPKYLMFSVEKIYVICQTGFQVSKLTKPNVYYGNFNKSGFKFQKIIFFIRSVIKGIVNFNLATVHIIYIGYVILIQFL